MENRIVEFCFRPESYFQGQGSTKKIVLIVENHAFKPNVGDYVEIPASHTFNYDVCVSGTVVAVIHKPAPQRTMEGKHILRCVIKVSNEDFHYAHQVIIDTDGEAEKYNKNPELNDYVAV